MIEKVFIIMAAKVLSKVIRNYSIKEKFLGSHIVLSDLKDLNYYT